MKNFAAYVHTRESKLVCCDAVYRMPIIVYTSDLHGDLDLYRAAGEAAIRTRADALIFGGDLCPGTPTGASPRLPIEQAGVHSLPSVPPL